MVAVVIIFILIVFLMGLVVYCLFKPDDKTIGSLVIAEDKEDGPYIFLEIDKGNIDELSKKSTVKLKVKIRTPKKQTL